MESPTDLDLLTNVHAALEEANNAIKAFLSRMDETSDPRGWVIARAALTEPLMVLVGSVEELISDIDPDAFEGD